MARQARTAGLAVPLLSGGGWAVDELLGLGGKEVEGAIFTAGLDPGNPRFASFNTRFLQAHGTPCEPSAYFVLDAAMALEHAARASLERTGKISPAAMKSALEAMKGVPLFTGKLTMDPGTHNPRNRPVLVMTLKDGKPLLLKAYRPG
jgi:branched-chain amino acid transport system substrate-binding protein